MGIEPMSRKWEFRILPLDEWCLCILLRTGCFRDNLDVIEYKGSAVRGSNPRSNLGKVRCYHYTNSASISQDSNLEYPLHRILAKPRTSLEEWRNH